MTTDSTDNRKRICIATGTRADWGLLSPLAYALNAQPACELSIIATNMHLSERFGMTVNEIEAEGFRPKKVPMECSDDSPQGRIAAMSECMTGMAGTLTALKPDMMVILGDRYEMLAAATVASMMRIPIAHIAGGTISEGAIDDSIRHAITKLSSLHFTETEEFRKRIITMGESPERVFFTGAIGVWSIANMDFMEKDKLAAEINTDLSKPYALATFHPATLDNGSPSEQCQAMLDGLIDTGSLNIIITYPNNDAGSAEIISTIEAFALQHPSRVTAIKSLGQRRYLSALRYAEFSIGNSSGGIVETASFGIPSIDIGIRQKGRTRAESVIHCETNKDSIQTAIRLAMNPEFKSFASKCPNPYFRENTLELMVEHIMTADTRSLQIKKFYDIPTN